MNPNENESLSPDEQADERLRLMTDAERRLWIRQVWRDERVRARRERWHLRYLQRVSQASPRTELSQTEIIGAMYERFVGLDRGEERQGSRMLNPQLSESEG